MGNAKNDISVCVANCLPNVPRVGLGDITNQVLQQGNGERTRCATKRASPQVAPLPVSCQALQSQQLATHAALPDAQKRRCTETANVWTALDDTENVESIKEYAEDIFDSLLKNESTFLLANYFEFQKEINPKMRAILLDWLNEVHMKYHMRSETLHLTINIIDRYLSKTSVAKRNLQLVGVVAMSIAAKYEEINPPSIDDFAYITDNSYTLADIISMECQVLRVLDFQVASTTAAHLMEPLLSMNESDDSHKDFVNYLVELALLQHQTLHFPPSQLVCAAILLSNEMAGRKIPWPAALREQYTEAQLSPLAARLECLFEKAPTEQLQAVRKKYQSSRRHHVANSWPIATGVRRTSFHR